MIYDLHDLADGDFLYYISPNYSNFIVVSQSHFLETITSLYLWYLYKLADWISGTDKYEFPFQERS